MIELRTRVSGKFTIGGTLLQVVVSLRIGLPRYSARASK